MNIANWLDEAARDKPTAPAIYSGKTLHATYGAFAARSRRVAAALRDQYGIAAGDRVALVMKNCPDYLELLYAVWWLGAVAVPVNAKLHPRESAWIVENSESRILFTDTGALGQDADLPETCTEIGLKGDAYQALLTAADPAEDDLARPAAVEGDDLAWLFYTSGTTGRPKGVMLTHRNLRMMCYCYGLDVDPAVPDATILYAAPMSHGAGLYNFIYIRVGARHCIPDSRGFEPEEIADLSRHFGETVQFAAPTMIKRLIESAKKTGYRGEGIRTIIYGGGPMYAADIDEALSLFGPRFAQIYGQGESPMTITAMRRELVADDSHPNWRARRDSVGRPQACIQLRIVDEDLTDLPAGSPGEILVKGDSVMKGYWRNPEATAETLVDGWLRTGDIGVLDADGFLTLTDRSKDLIISGGTNIYPREVEEVLMRHPAVLEASVVGTPSPEWGEDVVAFVVAREKDACSADVLEAWCRSEIASFKKPKRYHFVSELPKNSYGKILKTELREQAKTAQPD
ncbi:long-chain fatty acid--CoA ligase [Rhodospirillaceae bacterium KN72]|uniref:3-methylmercaptopropionyl-CoA ligase n=1 Tax=Pacificispira spongiicola TaxID=2729598 RepID=A0A7Y0DXB1_9PROT|nr:AMP-binding protein [Pacificispira spongiicola]NMM43318.1 long-chain fatty acid--CoA ligase [Pacificispira spongiicola]